MNIRYHEIFCYSECLCLRWKRIHYVVTNIEVYARCDRTETLTQCAEWSQLAVN